MRVKGGTTTRARHKKVLKLAKGQYGTRKANFRKAAPAVDHALQNAYTHRRTHRREIRSLWIVRIGAGCREFGTTYSVFINALKRAGIDLDRKILAEMAATDHESFGKLVERTKNLMKTTA